MISNIDLTNINYSYTMLKKIHESLPKNPDNYNLHYCVIFPKNDLKWFKKGFCGD